MYCSNCGFKNEGNKFCTHCGNKLEIKNEINSGKRENSGLKTASIVLGSLGIAESFVLFLSPLGFVLSLVGLILGIIANKKVKNVIGIILSSIGLFLSTIMVVLIILFIRFAVNVYNDNNDYFEYYDEYSSDHYGSDFGFNDLEKYFDNFFNEEEDNHNQHDNDYY